ncbi:MAG: SDR family oxidoreductase [Candidatus Marinimicrobia bacterium]|nr:SDR family oxidoreductase [Candidatus Neomarinimicrobiota bacterium]
MIQLVETDRPYLVMGLLDADSIAYAIGELIRQAGGRVIYTVQNERLKRIFLDHSKQLSPEEHAALDIRFCDVTQPDEVAALFAGVGTLAGIVHSIAYANPRTCLGRELHTDAVADITLSYEISCVSLATVARHALPNLDGRGSLLALTFDTRHVYPHYNWMGVHKAALEALVRALARRHGRDGLRVNALSAGPLSTKAASKIPGFGQLSQLWQDASPLPWDPHSDRRAVAEAAAFLVGPLARKITGQVLTVDGGASIMGGPLLDFERAPAAGSPEQSIE